MAGNAKVRRVILKIVERITNEYQPKKVILFGSYAYGEPTEDSDIDILIVTQRRLNAEGTYKIRQELTTKGFLRFSPTHFCERRGIRRDQRRYRRHNLSRLEIWGSAL